MSKNRRAAGRNGQHRQAIRHVLNDVPADLLTGSGDARDARAERAAAAQELAKAPAPQPAKSGGFLWFGRKAKPAATTGNGTAKAAPAKNGAPARHAAAASHAPVHPGAFELERRIQRLEEALSMARDDLVAATHELGDVHQRLAGAEKELGAERQTSAQWRDNANRLDEVAHGLQAAHEQLQHEHGALGAAHEAERQGREHWERVASEQMSALDELGAQVNSAAAELHAEREALAQVGERAAELEHELSATRTQWQEQVAELRAEWQGQVVELSATLAQEREEYQRTLEDERHTAERARAEQIAQHRAEVEQIQVEASTAIAALDAKLAEARAAGDALSADLTGARDEIARLSDDLQGVRGEAQAANARAREADELRMKAEQRIEELGEELAYVRAEVMGTAGRKKGGRGLFGGRKPAMVKAAEKQSRAAVSNNDVAAPSVDPDVEDIIERRLFGSV